MIFVRGVPEHLVCPSAPGARYSPSACTAAAFNAGSGSRLLAIVGWSSDFARGLPRREKTLLADDGLSGRGKKSALLPPSSSLPRRSARARKEGRSSPRSFPGLCLSLLLNIWKSFHQHRCARESGDIGRRRQAGAAAHACTEFAARTAHAGTSGLCVTLFSGSLFRALLSRPHGIRRAAQPQGETRGRGGNYSPRMPFLSFLPFLRFLPFLSSSTGRSSLWRIRRGGGRSCRGRSCRGLSRYVPSVPFYRARGRRGR